MAASTRVFNPDDIVVLFDGIPLSGIGPGGVTEEPTGEGFTRTVGTGGDVVYGVSNDTGVDITVRLLVTSMSNDVLSTGYEASKKGVLHTVVVKDLRGTSLCASTDAVVMNLPGKTVTNGSEENEWVLSCGQAARWVGGTLASTSL